ncbi:exocyst complex component Sec3-domain-containing protein [Entophlyctis helioformis]|nr:exocyst complex component Sec3-domain-containing protein [Entophlyctis helioformis]
MADEQLRKQLVQQLFENTLENDGEGGAEKLLLHARVVEGEKETRGVKDLLKVSFQNKEDGSGSAPGTSGSAISASAAAGGGDDDDDDDDAGGAGAGKASSKSKQKPRIVCLTSKKGKIRISKIKQERFGSLTILKQWGLDELKSIENGEEGHLVLNLGKTYRWIFEDLARKRAFISMFIKLCKTHSKRMPKLINISDTQVKEGEAAVVGQEGKAVSGDHLDASMSMSKSNGSFANDLADMGDDDKADEVHGLDTTAIDLGLVLSDFEWQASGDAAALEARLLSELQALEAANVHDIIQSETQANVVVDEIENALMELAQIDDWLAHYTYLLDSMGQDVHQIETQNKGLQVASTNQRLLLKAVDGLLSSLRFPGYALEVLRNEPLDDPDGVKECENAINKLMDTIQAKFPETGDMTAIRERKGLLQSYANDFAKRLCDYLTDFFQKQAEMYVQDKNRMSQKGSLKLYAHESLEQKLFKFRHLLRWLKDVDARAHLELQITYMRELSRPYKREIQEFIEVLKTQHTQRKVAMEEMDFVFVVQGGSVSSAASNAIKSAIRSGASNLAGGSGSDRAAGGSGGILSSGSGVGGIKQKMDSWRPYRKRLGNAGASSGTAGGDTEDGASPGAGGDDDDDVRGPRHLGNLKNSSQAGSSSSLDLSPEERMMPDEAVGHALLKLVNIMVREQNLVVDLFSMTKTSIGGPQVASSTATGEPESPAAVMSPTLLTIPAWQDELGKPREAFKDAKAQKRVQEMMDGIFEDVREQLLSTIEGGLKYDQSYAVGMLVHVEFYMKDYSNTSHVFVINMLESLQKRASHMFEKFVVEQIKAIEETKVTLRKRSGILPFVKTFPKFVDRMEMMLSNWDGLARRTVDKAYSRIIKSIFETLEAVAQQLGNDPKNASDEKDFLNIHILTVENMHHFYAEVRGRKVPGLDSFVKQAKVLYDVNLEAYCKVVIRKPLGKLLEFFEGIEGLLKTGPAEEVSFHIQYSKAALKDVLRKYPGKEIKKGLEALYKRVDKHFAEEEGLHQVVWRGIQEEFTRQLRRFEELIAKCYPEVSMRLDFTMDELLGFFSELAMAH